MRKSVSVLLCIFICIAGLTSCKREKSSNINLDNYDPLALAVDIEWAVISEPYVIFRDVQEWNGKDLGRGKKGEVLKVLGYSYSSENEKWVKFEKGYLPLKTVKVFSNKFQADKISKGFTE